MGDRTPIPSASHPPPTLGKPLTRAIRKPSRAAATFVSPARQRWEHKSAKPSRLQPLRDFAFSTLSNLHRGTSREGAKQKQC
jgi:hypothetical protein